MKKINTYIVEKLKINKDIQDQSKEKINSKFGFDEEKEIDLILYIVNDIINKDEESNFEIFRKDLKKWYSKINSKTHISKYVNESGTNKFSKLVIPYLNTLFDEDSEEFLDKYTVMIDSCLLKNKNIYAMLLYSSEETFGLRFEYTDKSKLILIFKTE